MTWRATLLVALCAISAAAAIAPDADVLLPWFEVDLRRPDVGLATTFSLVNGSTAPVRARVTVYTNWGIPVLEVPLTFERTEAHSIELRDWISRGVLPDRTLTAAQLAELQAALTGRPSPADALYRGSAFQDGVAVGYVIARTLDARPKALWGDTYSIDDTVNAFEAETLVALSPALQADCSLHGIRFIDRGQLAGGVELIVWSGRRFEPSSSPQPTGPKVKTTISVYDQAGRHVRDCTRELLAVEPILAGSLDPATPIGWLEIQTEDPTVVLQHLHAVTQASAELHSYCLPADLRPLGAAISLRTKAQGMDADNAPGVTVPIGSVVEFEYEVTNSGAVPLTSVTVTSDTGAEVSCPRSGLAPSASMTCTSTATLEGLLLVNAATAKGTAPDGTRVRASDGAYVSAACDSGPLTVDLGLAHRPEDQQQPPDAANQPPGYLTYGDGFLYLYLKISNRGRSTLTDFSVSVDGHVVPSVICGLNQLLGGEYVGCWTLSLPSEGTHAIDASVTARDQCFTTVTATDRVYYTGAPHLTIETYLGNDEADTFPGPTTPYPYSATWRFVVTNVGRMQLTNVSVTHDPQPRSVSPPDPSPVCPQTTLQPGGSMICTAQRQAAQGQNSNVGTATGCYYGWCYQASDPAYFFASTSH